MEQKSVKGTQTEKNLLAAFIGESQARNKYTYFAGIAKKEGYEQISAVFSATADNEREHAKRYYSYIGDAVLDVCTTGNITGIGDTKHNLKICIAGEFAEWDHIYPGFAQVAEEEGFFEIAQLFRHVAAVEDHHGKRYKKLLENLENNKVFAKDTSTTWMCRNCGHLHESAKAPEACPTCLHPKAYFEVLCDNF